VSARRFELFFTTGAAYDLHRRRVGTVERSMPWSSLRPARLSAQLVARARHSWTLLCFNEYRSAFAMATLNHALGQAAVPLDLWSVASQFPGQELLHAELCARVVARLGGAVPLAYEAETFGEQRPPELSFAQWAHTLVVRYCCVNETLSLRLLAASRRAATAPLVRRVLARLVKDEGLHSSFGWMYLEWAAPDLTPAERARLGAVARHAVEAFAPAWRKGGPSAPDDRVFGWIDAEALRALGEKAVERDVIARLRGYGIEA
jgi:hypothetical protein